MIPELSIKRFWAKVDTSGGEHACWPWLGERFRCGYGRVRIQWKKRQTHRVSLSISTGVEPGPSIYALHSCDNRLCVNPHHLRWGTAAENTADMDGRGRRGDCANLGTQNGRATLTEAKVRAIRADSRSLRAIAEAFGTSKGTVCNIKSRRTWRHLEN